MTVSPFNRIKAALVAQRNEISHSPKAASRLISELGIRDILVDGTADKKASNKKKASPGEVAANIKTPHRKAPKKAARR